MTNSQTLHKTVAGLRQFYIANERGHIGIFVL
jgi:hypothetical protein